MEDQIDPRAENGCGVGAVHDETQCLAVLRSSIVLHDTVLEASGSTHGVWIRGVDADTDK